MCVSFSQRPSAYVYQPNTGPYVPGLQREGIRRDTKQNFLMTSILDVRKDVGSPSYSCLEKQA